MVSSFFIGSSLLILRLSSLFFLSFSCALYTSISLSFHYPLLPFYPFTFLFLLRLRGISLIFLLPLTYRLRIMVFFLSLHFPSSIINLLFFFYFHISVASSVLILHLPFSSFYPYMRITCFFFPVQFSLTTFLPASHPPTGCPSCLALVGEKRWHKSSFLFLSRRSQSRWRRRRRRGGREAERRETLSGNQGNFNSKPGMIYDADHLLPECSF